MEKCGYRSVIACSARGYFCSIDVNLTMRHGRIVKNTGDGVLAEFASVVDAAALSLAGQ
jgi:class 3 adenylate cyclase